jgi:hypothetical protein
VNNRQTAEVMKAAIEHDVAVHGMYLGATASAARRKRIKTGFVYFLTAAGRIKIGYAVDVAARVRELQIGCPFPMTLLGVISGAISLEKRWHRAFAAVHTQGEWFLADPDLVARIQAEATLAVSTAQLHEILGAYEVRGFPSNLQAAK